MKYKYNPAMADVLSNFKDFNHCFHISKDTNIIGVRDSNANRRFAIAKFDNLNWSHDFYLNNTQQFSSLYNMVKGDIETEDGKVIITNDTTRVKITYNFGRPVTNPNIERRIRINYDSLFDFNDENCIYRANISDSSFNNILGITSNMGFSHLVLEPSGRILGADINSEINHHEQGNIRSEANQFSQDLQPEINKLTKNLSMDRKDFTFLKGDYTLSVHEIIYDEATSYIFVILENKSLEGVELKYYIAYREKRD